MMADAQNEKLIAEARMMDSQTRAMAEQAKIELEQAKLGMQQGQVDPIKIAEMQLRQQEMNQRQQDAMLDAVNRKRDRESRERLATVKLTEELIRNPEGLGIAQSIIRPDMMQRLEGNEQSLDGTKTGEV